MYGLVKNMYIILLGKPPAKWPLGKPVKYEDKIKLSRREIGCEEGIWMGLTLESAQCWASVLAALNF
jgi:hypothetical protein